MNEYSIAESADLESFMEPERIRLAGEPALVTAEVLLRAGRQLIYGTYRTKSLPSACRAALQEHPGAELLQVRRMVEIPNEEEGPSTKL